MGQEWDGGDIAFRTEVWTEALRVLKPGGHLLAFGGSRTYHRLATAIENSGFEIRDQILWIYGSGFPKSHNIGKGVEKKNGEVKVIGKKKGAGSTGSSYISNKIEYVDGDVGVFKKEYNDIEITNDWKGWGTALKPAHEPIVMARKPLSEKTIVDNVLEWGTGGINIDESRIPYTPSEVSGINFDRPRLREKKDDWVYELGTTWEDPNVMEYNTEGRFPANVLLSEEAAENLDGHSGASKFFYVAKPSKKEKNEGLEDFEEKQMDLSRKEGNPGGDNPRNRGVNKRKNHHPTIKPVKLMEYLCKLITRKEGVILDMFMGSGTTGIAAIKNGYSFIGIEREPDYMDIAKTRMEYETKKKW
jgi:site-specific DNA-methyltransferase (adenine-specific)